MPTCGVATVVRTKATCAVANLEAFKGVLVDRCRLAAVTDETSSLRKLGVAIGLGNEIASLSTGTCECIWVTANGAGELERAPPNFAGDTYVGANEPSC